MKIKRKIKFNIMGCQQQIVLQQWFRLFTAMGPQAY